MEEVIPLKNFTSVSVMEAVGSIMTNKYSEGYPGASYYGILTWLKHYARSVPWKRSGWIQRDERHKSKVSEAYNQKSSINVQGNSMVEVVLSEGRLFSWTWVWLGEFPWFLLYNLGYLQYALELDQDSEIPSPKELESRSFEANNRAV
ncbi:hypothetical protein Ahy_A07g035311 isoform C [Arachis hypogaea]|uniref:Serine hydroxymethyltransferase-like domain-containing protein n=1 Tax=Arachis hypogaea TaxID=3818 RepID=A0A445CDP7_ARAHY|nr:hypothetical protein Ahy_A07g035311 isoform C [Arachis hypogaea]